MSNNNRKGNSNQYRAITYWREKKYLVGKVEDGARFAPVRDLFSLFDLACINQEELLLIQVKSNRPGTHKDFKEFSYKYPLNGIRYLQMVWVDYKGWKIWEYSKGKSAKILDETNKKLLKENCGEIYLYPSDKDFFEVCNKEKGHKGKHAAIDSHTGEVRVEW